MLFWCQQSWEWWFQFYTNLSLWTCRSVHFCRRMPERWQRWNQISRRADSCWQKLCGRTDWANLERNIDKTLRVERSYSYSDDVSDAFLTGKTPLHSLNRSLQGCQQLKQSPAIFWCIGFCGCNQELSSKRVLSAERLWNAKHWYWYFFVQRIVLRLRVYCHRKDSWQEPRRSWNRRWRFFLTALTFTSCCCLAASFEKEYSWIPSIWGDVPPNFTLLLRN